MSTRLAIDAFCLGLAVALLVSLLAQSAHAQESLQWLYDGRPLDDWVAALEAEDASQRSNAVKAVATFREDRPEHVRPLLLGMLEDPNHVVRRDAAWAWASSGTTVDAPETVVAALQRRLLDSKEHRGVREAAATALGYFFVPGARALADAIDQIGDKKLQRETIEKLSEVPMNIVDDLENLPGLHAIIRKAENQPTRSSFIDRIDRLRRLLQQHEDPGVRAIALARVQAAREAADLAVEKFVKVVNEQKSDADPMTLKVLWSWSAHPKASDAVAALSDIMQTGDDHQRLWAAATLAAITPDSEEGDRAVSNLINYYVQEIKDGDAGPDAISIFLHYTAGRTSRRNEIFRGILRELEGEQADLVQRVWANVLGEMGIEAPEVLSSLLQDDDPQVRQQAAQEVKRNAWDDPQILSALAEIVRNSNEQRYVLEAALEALAEIDSEAKKVPPLDDEILIRLIQYPWLNERHPWLREQLSEGGKSLADKLVAALNEPAEQVRQEQVRSDHSPSSEIIDALAAVGEPAVPALRRLTIEHAVERESFQAAHELDAELGRQAAYALGQIEPKGVETLVELSRHDDSAVRREAVYALLFTGQAAGKSPSEESIAALIAAAKNENAAVRGQALQAIGQLREPDDRAVAVVVDNLEHENVEIARQAVQTLGRFAKERPHQVVRAYAEALQRDQWKVRWEILEALKSLGPGAEAALPEIQALVGRQDLRNKPLQTIAAMGPAAEQAKDLLLDRLESPDDWQRFWAAVALAQFASGVEAALPALIEHLRSESQTEDRSEALRVVAAEALGEIGPRARSASEPLLELVHRELQKPPPTVQDVRGPEPRPDEVIEAAVEALEKIGWRPVETIPILDDIRESAAELAEKQNPHAQAAATKALQIYRLGEPPPADQLVPQLVRDEERLRAMGEKAVPVLIDALEDSDLIDSAVQSLGILSETAAPAVPQLLDIVRDRRWRSGVRAAAIEALGKIGNAARPAIPYLQELADTNGISRDEQQLAKAAREAMARIEAR